MSDTLAVPWVIEFRLPHSAESIKVQLENQLILGRRDDQSSTQPDIDLGAYGAEDKGVSRRHAAIVVEDNQMMVMDLNSGNGTFLNDVKLEPNVRHPLRNDDHLKLGLMQIDVNVIISPIYDTGLFSAKQSVVAPVPQGKGQTILIVEDDNEVAKVLSLVLERAGYTTLVCREVVSAIRLFNQKQPSAVILDLMLPDMPGMEFCRYVRRDVQRNSTPVIILSAAKTPANVALALEAGANIFLGKPVSAQELRHVVTSLVGQHEKGVASLHTRQLVGTAPLQKVPAEARHDAVVLFVAGHNDSPITLTIQNAVTFGRSTNAQARTHIDLTRFDAMEYGVSRVHMTLHNKDGKFYAEDLDSVNGTYVNGDPLTPHQLVELHNADEVRLGRLRIYIYFLEGHERDLLSP